MYRKKIFIVCALVAVSAFAVVTSNCWAQPLVTGNLTIYYDFDEIVTNGDGDKQILDESGNGFHATINEADPADLMPGSFTIGPGVRGAGAGDFMPSVDEFDTAIYLDADGKNITDNFPDLLPTSGVNGGDGYSMAVWVNVSDNVIDAHSVWQTRTSESNFTHFQLQANGKLRMTLRGNGGCCVDNIVNEQRFINGDPDVGDPYPFDEWFHFAGTFDMPSNTWAMYYNGQQIATGDGTGTGQVGNWGGLDVDFFGAGTGNLPSRRGRDTDGLMDELYVFNRALSASEIETLFNLEDVSIADLNMDGFVDGLDLGILLGEWDPAVAAAMGITRGGAVPEPTSAVLVLTAVALASVRRRW